MCPHLGGAMEKVVEGYNDDPQAQELLTELSLTSPNDKGYYV
jgi:hypothetical protein